MKRLVLVLFALALTAGISAAQFVEQWNTLAVAPFWSELFYAGAEHVDGGIVAVGGQYNQPLARSETVLCRMDVNGNVLWRNTYFIGGYTTTMFDMCARNGTDDEFIAVGYREPAARESFLIVFNDSGTVTHFVNHGADNGTWYSIEPAPAGGYICAGITNSGEGIVMKMNDAFNTEWSYTYGTYDTNRIYDIIPTSDGGYAFTAQVINPPNTSYAWTAKIDASGNYVWSTVHTGFYFGVGRCVVEAPDGGIITAGSAAGLFLVVKNNNVGTQVWSNNFGSDAGTEYCDFIGAAPDGGYYLFGDGQSPFTIDKDTWLIKIDENGNELWNQLYQRPLYQTVESCIMVNGGQDIVTFGSDNNGMSNSGDCNAVRYNKVGDLEAAIWSFWFVDLPVSGGSFDYYVSATNNTNSGMQVDAWIQILHLDTGMSVELQSFSNVGIGANSEATASLSQFIPAEAPGGIYQMSLHLGDYPWTPTVSAAYYIIKAGPVADGVDLTVFERPEQWISSGGFEGVESVIAVAETLPSEFALGAAYPNPFNPSTTLSINLPETADLNVSVFNVTGQLVATLANGQYNAGSHTLTFDASNLSGGVYFVHASAKGWSDVQKVVLMK
jgi:Secretion system C-terminal sorting domain